MELPVALAIDRNGSKIQDPLSQFVTVYLPTAGDPSYTGGQALSGAWYIQKIDNVAGTITFATGDHDIATAWVDKGSLTYQLFAEAFRGI